MPKVVLYDDQGNAQEIEKFVLTWEKDKNTCGMVTYCNNELIMNAIVESFKNLKRDADNDAIFNEIVEMIMNAVNAPTMRLVK